MKPTRIIGTAALSCLTLVLTGCLVVPIPGTGQKVTSRWKTQASELAGCQATREHVTCQLGSPTWDFQDLHVTGYTWSGVEWSVLWLAAGGYSAGGGVLDFPAKRVLWMAFDEDERLKHSQVVSRSESKTGWEQAMRWRQKQVPPLTTVPSARFAPLRPPPGRAYVHIFWDRGRNTSPVGSIYIDGQERARIRKGCFTTFALEPGSRRLSVLGNRLELDLAAGEICYLDFHPKRSGASVPQVLFRRTETEVLPRLQRLTYCQ